MKLYKLTTDLYLDKQLEKMNEILLIENLIDLGLEYTEVNYLCKLTQSMTIEHKKGFFIKVAKYEIKNEDRDVYSMSGKSKGILKDIYHDKNFQRPLTRMFLRTIVGFVNHPTIDNNHWKAIKNCHNFDLYNDYDRLMENFWADKVLSRPVKKIISIRLRRIEHVNDRKKIFENLLSTRFAKLRVLNNFFKGNVADVKIAVDYDNKIYKKKFNIEDFAHRYRREAKIRHRQNELEFQRPLRAKIKDNGDLQVFKKNILFHQYKISKSLMITQKFDYQGFLEDIANETQPMKKLRLY